MISLLIQRGDITDSTQVCDVLDLAPGKPILGIIQVTLMINVSRR